MGQTFIMGSTQPLVFSQGRTRGDPTDSRELENDKDEGTGLYLCYHVLKSQGILKCQIIAKCQIISKRNPNKFGLSKPSEFPFVCLLQVSEAKFVARGCRLSRRKLGIRGRELLVVTTIPY